MGRVRKYEPQAAETPDQFSLSDFSFKLVAVEVKNAKAANFASKYKLTLPTPVRSRI
jgi:hypothetical protein